MKCGLSSLRNRADPDNLTLFLSPVTSSGRFQIDADVLKLDSPKFGDISHIAPSEDTTMTIRFPQGGAIDYLSLHHRNMTDSVNRVKLNASGSLPDAKSLSNALSSRLMNYDLPTHVLPRPLKRGTFQPGTQLTLGCSTATVDRELGRGAYGVVVLLKDAGQFNTGAIAVKSQSPIGCLAWEYEILKKVEDRVRKSSQQVAGRLPFPSALSFVSVADGAMLAMSAGSRSGLNIVDLVNVYAKLGEQVPEIVALHYTARMLHHLGVLHWHAKVMVRKNSFISFHPRTHILL